MRPTTVLIQWSEAGHPLNENTTMDFWEFEAAAEEAALGHPGGCYLKTMITVSFDEGSTYECRIDLGAGYNCERGFQDGIAKRIKYFDPTRSMPPEAMENYIKSHEMWLEMDFTQDDGEGETPGVIPALCWPIVAPCCKFDDQATNTLPYRVDLTRAGEQFVIPGCEVDAPQSQSSQLNLF